MTIKIPNPSPSNHFCVPYALALLLKVSVDDAVVLLKEKLGDQPIAGIYFPTALRILEEHGYTYVECRKLDHECTYFVVIPGHVLVVHDGIIIDNGPYNKQPFERLRKIWHCFEIFNTENR